MSIIEKKLSIEERVKVVIADQLCEDEDQITNDKMLEDDFGADSLDAVVLTMALEEEFDIEISDDDALKLKTVQDVVNLVQERVVTQ